MRVNFTKDHSTLKFAAGILYAMDVPETAISIIIGRSRSQLNKKWKDDPQVVKVRKIMTKRLEGKIEKDAFALIERIRDIAFSKPDKISGGDVLKAASMLLRMLGKETEAPYPFTDPTYMAKYRQEGD